MELGRVLQEGLEQRELHERQRLAEPQIETAQTLEELTEQYADLSERITALPPREPERIVDLDGGRGRFLDRYVGASFETDNEEIPELHLKLQTGHYVDEEGDYDHRQSTYLIVDWSGKGFMTNGTVGTQTNKTIRHEAIQAPDQHTNIAEASRILGLIEESVSEAEKALSPAIA